MAELAILGTEEFLVGFELAGVRKTYRVTTDVHASVKKAMQQPDVGILVIAQNTIDELEPHMQRELSKSTNPVVVVLGDKQEQSQLRKDIVRAIGVDLWKSE